VKLVAKQKCERKQPLRFKESAMQTARVLLAALSVAAAVAAGCQKTQHGGHPQGAGGHVTTEHGGTVPDPVVAALERQSPGAKITKFHSHTRANGSKTWHLHYATPDGKEEEAKFEATGEPIE
jgi:hypothetical protein